MNGNVSTSSGQNEFLIYEILCKDRVKGYIVGSEHYVDPADVELNKVFQDVVSKTTTAYLEIIPEGSGFHAPQTLLDHIVKDFTGQGNIPYDLHTVNESLAGHEAILKIKLEKDEIPGLTWQALQERLAKLNPVEKLAAYHSILNLDFKVMDHAFDEHIYNKLKAAQINIRPFENHEFSEQLTSKVTIVVKGVLQSLSASPPKITTEDLPKFKANPREEHYWLWKRGQAKDFAIQLDKSPAPESHEIVLQQRRNEGMAKRIDEVITNMPYEMPLFVCGASHLLDKRIGKTIFDWLHDRGFEVRQLK